MISWTYSVRKNFTKRLGALVGVPLAQPHEAPNSWFMRAAALQGCSDKEFASYLGFNFGRDFDSLFYYAFAKESPNAPEVENLMSGRAFFSRGARSGRPMEGLGGKGRYRFCPLCLKDQRVPCIHLYCRMRELVFCPWHKCLLEDQCPNCHAPVELCRDMMEPVKGEPGVEDLSRCLDCQQPLHATQPISIDRQFLYSGLYWLRDWGQDGPTPSGGEGLSPAVLSEQRKRLTWRTQMMQQMSPEDLSYITL